MKETSSIYTPQSNNKIIKKLVKKLCNGNTPSNTYFSYFNKYDVYVTSGTRDFINVSIYQKNNGKNNLHIIDFSFDFWTRKLIFNMQSYGENFYDYIFEDSIIESFKELFSFEGISIVNDYELSDDEIIYRNILSEKDDYSPDSINEAYKAINFINNRKDWINSINS